ncbi:MAG: hypothetical protein ACI4JJ_07100 [Huintestinicola sp.]
MKLYSKDTVVRTMTAMQKTGRFAHTYILTGEKGVGKKVCAKYIAMQLLCDKKCACGKCRQCRRILNGQHPDVIIPEKDKDKKPPIYTVELMRQLVADCFVSPNDCDRKVYILPDCEGWKDAAQDTLLKITEEPPDTVYFIFTAQSKSIFLPTLISRSMVIDIPEGSREDCTLFLEAEGKYPQDKILEAVENFGGNIGNCLEYLSGKSKLSETAELVKAMTEDIISCDEYHLAVHLNKAAVSKENLRQTLDMLARVIRDGCTVKTGGQGLTGCFRQGALRLADRTSLEEMLAMYDAICTASDRCTKNVNTSACAAALCGAILG